MGKGSFVESRDCKVEVTTIDGKKSIGFINVLGYDRLSDCLQQHSSDFIILYNTGSYTNRTLFILKSNILTVEEVK